jgi:hypothetical protein
MQNLTKTFPSPVINLPNKMDWQDGGMAEKSFDQMVT